jgi:hypothetical protein
MMQQQSQIFMLLIFFPTDSEVVLNWIMILP